MCCGCSEGVQQQQLGGDGAVRDWLLLHESSHPRDAPAPHSAVPDAPRRIPGGNSRLCLNAALCLELSAAVIVDRHVVMESL